MWWMYFLIATVIIIAVVIGLNQRKEIEQLRAEGKIVERSYRYAEKGEEFTAKIGNYSVLKDQLVKLVTSCGMEGNTDSQVIFKSANFSAHLYKVDFDEAFGIGIYRFEFTQWRTAEYGYADDNKMNMLMTAVEKAFLQLDPNTGVKSYDLNFKTKRSVF